MEKVKTNKKSSTSKSVKTKKSNANTRARKKVVLDETFNQKSFSFIDLLKLIFKIVTLPLYMVYVFLFKIPTEGPAPVIGFLRFVLFLTIGYYFEHNHKLDYLIKDYANAHNWISGLAETILGFYAIIMLLNIFLSFIEIFGFSTGSYWHDPYENASNVSYSGYDAIEKGLSYRDSLLKAEHTPGKIKQLKKTGFITKERLSDLGSSPEVDKALSLLNSQMRAMHNPDKLKTLESMFGGK